MVLESDHCLYSNVQNVVLPGGITKELRIDIVGFGKPISKVEVRITDDSDPSLLYILHVSESDFNLIKSQQGLLVDFSNFPVHLVKLLEQCLSSTKGFLLILEENGLECYLKVVQPIDLKNLCYIALRIARGSDSEIMRHMHSQILLLKKKISSKEEECHCTLSQLNQLQHELSQKEIKNKKVLDEWQQEQNKLKAQLSKEMDVLKEQLLQERKRDLDSAAYQRESLNTKIEDLSREATKYKNKHYQVSEKYEQAQQKIGELSMKIQNLEELQKAMNRELVDLRKHKAEWESECRKKDQDFDQAQCHTKALDKEIERLKSRLTRQEGQLRQADSEQVRLKSALARSQETVQSRNDLVLQLNGDLTKANLIIKERQKELEKVHGELQKFVSLKHEAEHKLKNLSLEMKLLRANAERDEARIKALEETEKKLQEQLTAANETISAKDEQHKKCGELISYLNRSLTRQQLDPSPPPTAHGMSVFHNSAPSAPILYTLGSSLGRAGLGAGLHVSGPPLTRMPGSNAIHSQPFSSTPLVASAAAGGTEVTTRRSFPGALMQPSGNNGNLSNGTPAARPMVDRMTLSQLQAKDDSQSQNQVNAPTHSASDPNSKRVLSKSKSQSSLGVGASNPSNSKVKSVLKGNNADKENQERAAYKPSAYFQPNKIITKF